MPGGYHELDTVFAWLELADELCWQLAGELRLDLSGEVQISTGEDNLVTKAVRLLERECRREFPLHIRLHKRIPAGGGLAGGSSNAAALLYSVNRELQLGLPIEQLAAELGADVAYCVHGGTRRGTHRGERLAALSPAPALSVLLVFPPFGCPTGEVYRIWDRDQPRPARGCAARMAAACENGSVEGVRAALGNDLQPAAEELRPELLHIQREMKDHGCSHVMLSGSGSTMLAFFTQEDEALAARERLGGVVTRIRPEGRG